MKERSDAVLAYWFESTAALRNGEVPEECFALWFGGGATLDDDIRQRFAEDLICAATGRYKQWREAPDQCLALIIVLDQFSRNIHRGTPQAFATDDQALRLASNGIESGQAQRVAPICRAFYYMPLEHSERLEDQSQCVRLFEDLVEDGPASQASLFEGFLKYAIDHQKIIEKFGRFPHRNAILGRTSTPEEVAYLEDSGQTFGQG